MPEGDTVWRQARDLHRALAGRTLHKTDFRFPALAEINLAGQTIAGAYARGKHLFICAGDAFIHSHLKMEGSWHLYSTNPQGRTRWRRPVHAARAVLQANARTDSAGAPLAGSSPVEAVGFNLGLLEVLTRQQALDSVTHLGPDLLGPDWNLTQALANLSKRPQRMIGPALLDQRNLAGIGTIYRAETLFLAGIDPRSRLEAVPDLAGTLEITKKLIEANKTRTQRITRSTKEPLWCYGRTNQPCYRCGASIIKEELSDKGSGDLVFGQLPRALATAEDTARLSFRCPGCQVLYA